jgi:hypothetical protein
MHGMNKLSYLMRQIVVLLPMIFLIPSAQVHGMSFEKAQELSSRYTSNEFLEKLVAQFNLDGVHANVVKEHFKAHYSNVKFLRKIFTEVEKSKDPGNDGGRALVQRLSALWMYGGLRLIPYEQQLHYFVYMRNLTEVVSPSECRALITGASTEKLQSNQSIEFRYLNLVDAEILQNYFEMQRAALDSYVSGVNVKREISNEQREIAKGSIAAEMNALLNYHQSGDELKEVWRNSSSATDAQVCELGKVLMEVFLRGDNDVNRLQVQHYLDRYTYTGS